MDSAQKGRGEERDQPRALRGPDQAAKVRAEELFPIDEVEPGF
jgi:hypothetical protein